MSPRDLPSRTLYQGRDRAGARSFLYAIGLAAEDIGKPFVGVSNVWTETMPCNFGLRDLAAPLKKGIKAAGANPMEFNTIAISDGITMGTEGMKTSLVSREVIADSIELVARGHMFDALVTLCACDKTIPASAIALVRVDRPGFLLYGGSIMAGTWRGKQVAVGEVYEAIGAGAGGELTDARRAAPSTTRSPRSPQAVARPTRCFTCSPWRARSASTSRSTISIASAAVLLCCATSSPVDVLPRSSCTEPEGSAS